MEGRGNKRFRAILATLSVLVIVAAAFVLDGMRKEGSGLRWPWSSGAIVQAPGTATVTCKERYTRCNDVISTVTEVPLGDFESTLAAMSAGWNLSESTSSQAILQRDIDGFCPEHENYRLIALYKATPGDVSHVFVFRGRKIDPAFIVKERKDLTEERLYPQERARLKQGLVVSLDPNDPEDLDLDQKITLYLQGIVEGR